MTDPYQPPKQHPGDMQGVIEESALKGPPCPECGSANTSIDSVLRTRPSIIAVIFFGWLFLLIRGAFSVRKSICLDCGEEHRYKSAGSWIAMGIVLLMVLVVVMAFIEG